MIARRTLLGGLFTAATASRVPAQQRDRTRSVGIALEASPLANMEGPNPVSDTMRGFVHGLRDLGWVEGKNLVIERRTAEGKPERAPGILAELVTRGVDVILVSGSLWLIEAARRATATVPIVAGFAVGEDPAVLGLVASLARPGGNLTGISFTPGADLAKKRHQLLTELAPRAKRVAWLGTKSQQRLHPPETAATSARLVFVVAEEPTEFPQAFATILREGADALHVLGSGVLFVHRAQIMEFAAAHRLPAAYSSRNWVDEGGLLGYGPNPQRAFRQMAGLADRILKGAKPAELPVQLPDRFDFVVNRKTAESLGLTIPPSILAAAEVIE